MGAPGELFRAHPHAKPSRANFFARKTQQNGDAETDNTSATEKRAKNTRFSPAKATPVSTPRGHKLAKATGVSKNRTAWSTGPGRGTGGRRQGQGGNTRTTGTPDWRSPRGLRGLVGLRDDAPSEARGADGSRAGRPRGGWKSGGAKQRRRSGGAAHGHTQRQGPAGSQARRRPKHRRRPKQHRQTESLQPQERLDRRHFADSLD